MADESANAGGILGHLPPWPRKALNNSVIAMEQAYRQRKGLPTLSDADIEALKAGQQWLGKVEMVDPHPSRLRLLQLPRPRLLRPPQFQRLRRAPD